MRKSVLILAILGALITSSAFSGYSQLVTRQSELNRTEAPDYLNITKK